MVITRPLLLPSHKQQQLTCGAVKRRATIRTLIYRLIRERTFLQTGPRKTQKNTKENMENMKNVGRKKKMKNIERRERDINIFKPFLSTTNGK